METTNNQALIYKSMIYSYICAKFWSYNPQCSIIPIWHSLALGQIRIIEHFGLYDAQLCSHIITIYDLY